MNDGLLAVEPLIRIGFFLSILAGMAAWEPAAPRWLDRRLRWLVVTPDMHRVHHSIYPQETNSNFGFNLPWWDRLLGTHRDQPREGHAGMTIGLEQCRTRRDLRLDQMRLQPFRGPAGGYPINFRQGTT